MPPLPEYPRLRWPLDIRLERIEGQEILLLRCPLGFSQEPLLLIPGVGPILATFNGQHSIDQIAEQFTPHGLRTEHIRELVKLLDGHKYLDTPEFRLHEQSIKNNFLLQQIRPAVFAGLSYPDSQKELNQFLDQYLIATQLKPDSKHTDLKFLISPHIDYRRGGKTYGSAYSLLNGHRHDLYILMGTAHQYSEGLFHLTRKHFSCPLSEAKNDLDFTDTLAGKYGIDRSYQDEFLHKQEHSLELQIPFLKKVRPDAVIVPILIGGFHKFVREGSLPSHDGIYEDFVGALTELMQSRINQGAKICFIAGVDMAHVGRSFGDPNNLTAEQMEIVRKQDLEYLEAVRTQDKSRLFNHIAMDNDSRRICGFPTIYTILDVMERLSIKCLNSLCEYDQAVDYKTDCAVTFAAMGLYK